jgi:hypothetical protein
MSGVSVTVIFDMHQNDVAYANTIFDKISGISLNKRKESDRISDKVFSKISKGWPR